MSPPEHSPNGSTKVSIYFKISNSLRDIINKKRNATARAIALRP